MTRNPITIIEKLIANPTTSFWLRNALLTALDRDILQAAVEAEYMAKLLRERYNYLECPCDHEE